MTILVHQMGKVGSTAITRSLERSGFACIQTHAVGHEALTGMLNFFLNPLTEIDRVVHEQNLFRDQIVATKLLQRCRAEPWESLKVITLARDPVDRWFSALLQNFPSHLNSARGYLRREHGQESPDDLECLSAALSRILQVIQDVPESQGLEQVLSGAWPIEFARDPDADLYLRWILGELTVPFTWFEQQLAKPFGISIFELDVSSGSAHVEHEGVDLLYLGFEAMRDQPVKAQRVLSAFVQTEVKIGKHNVSGQKPNFEIMQRLRERFERQFRYCSLLRKSRYCKHFGYL